MGTGRVWWVGSRRESECLVGGESCGVSVRVVYFSGFVVVR